MNARLRNLIAGFADWFDSTATRCRTLAGRLRGWAGR